jgi:hypothetical protein
MKLESLNDTSSYALASMGMGLVLTFGSYNGTASTTDFGYNLACLNNPTSMAYVDPSQYKNLPALEPQKIVSRQEFAHVFSEFLTKLMTNMESVPAEVHAEISRRPWDFV